MPVKRWQEGTALEVLFPRGEGWRSVVGLVVVVALLLCDHDTHSGLSAEE